MNKIGRPPKSDPPPFGKRLAAFRHRYGMTQEQLAESLGVTIKTIDYYERRARKPSIEILVKLAELFDTTTDELLGRPPKAILPTRPGPPSALEVRLDAVRKLPKTQQKTVIAMLDGVLAMEAQ